MEKVIDALHAAGVAAPWIVGVLTFWLVLHYGPTWMITVSKSLLEHKRFDQERQESWARIQLAQKRREESEARLTSDQGLRTQGQDGIDTQPKLPPSSSEPTWTQS